MSKRNHPLPKTVHPKRLEPRRHEIGKKWDKDKIDPPFTYSLFVEKGKKYVNFPSEVAFSIVHLENILKNCKKSKIKGKMLQFGMVITIPKGLKLKPSKMVYKRGKENAKNKKSKKSD